MRYIKFLVVSIFSVILVTSCIKRPADGALTNASFSVSSKQQVYFSKGNLQYQPSTKTWRFAENQWETVRKSNENISPNYDGFIDLFGWGTGEDPTNCSSEIYKYQYFSDWGNNPISNGGCEPNRWRTLSFDELNYLLFERNTSSGLRYAKSIVNNVEGVVILPDKWSTKIYDFKNANSEFCLFHQNMISQEQWKKLELVGCVFLPLTGFRIGTQVSEIETYGSYWTSSNSGNICAYSLRIFDKELHFNDHFCRNNGFAVRLVCDK